MALQRGYECLGSDDTCISEWMKGTRPRKMGGEKGGHYVVGARWCRQLSSNCGGREV